MAARNPLKVLILTSSYPRNEHDTASVFLRYFAHSLRQRGVSVHVLAPASDSHGTTEEDGVVITRFRYLPRRWRRLAYGAGMLPNLRHNSLLWLTVPFYIGAMLLAAVAAVRRHRIQLIHAHWILPQAPVAVLAKFLSGVPVVATAHGGDVFALNHPVLKTLKNFVLRRCDAWTANTAATARAAATSDRSPAAQIIPMGVDTNRFRSGRGQALRALIPAEDFLLLYVGRLVDKKGVDCLIRAYALLDHDALRARTRLWIVGDGDRKEALQTLSRELGVSPAVRFWGAIPNQQLPDFYAAADLFVAPSVVTESGDTEGQGVVLLEAFASRVPVVATDVGGIGEVVRHGETGWLVPPRDPRKLSQAIARLLADRTLRDRLAGDALRQVRARYDWSTVAAKFHGLYAEITGTI